MISPSYFLVIETKNLFSKTSCLEAHFSVCHQKALVPKLPNVLDLRKKLNAFSALHVPIVLLDEDIIKL